jgi:hypothetical protein
MLMAVSELAALPLASAVRLRPTSSTPFCSRLGRQTFCHRKAAQPQRLSHGRTVRQSLTALLSGKAA